MTFWQQKRVLVTGGAGFVGRWLVRELNLRHAEAHIVDLAPPRNFDTSHGFHAADLRDLAAVERLLSELQPAVIVHLAGLPGVAASQEQPEVAYESNVLATFNLLEAGRRQRQTRLADATPLEAIVAVSSNHVYGHQSQRPTNEDAPLRGTGMYAASKLCGDALGRAYGKGYGLPVGIARMTNSYGGDDHHVSHIITGSILAVLRGERPVIQQSGHDRKGYLYIRDTVAGLLAVAEGVAHNGELRGEAFNLAPNEAVSTLELVRAIVAAAGSDLEPLVTNPKTAFENELLDNSKARRLLGWSPRFSLDAGLQETIAWYRERT